MKKSNIFNYVFIIGLAILILNDHLLKDVFGNWWTGKLSDFAGVLILPMFIKYLFSINTKNSIIVTVLFFVFWKSPYSQFIIDRFNSIGLFGINRVVDYSDFLAFMILPLSIFVLNNTDKFEINLKDNRTRKFATNSLVFVSIMAFTATSIDDDYVPFPYESCCSRNPTNVELGAGRLYIPTVFTPNGNGLNDFFQVSVDADIASIDTFMIVDWYTGDTVFYEVDMTEIIPENGFDGVVNDTVRAAEYYYQIVVTSTDNVSGKFGGSVCCLPCTEPLNVSIPPSLENCAFPIQFNVNTGYDENIDPAEDIDCFQ